MLPDAEAVGLKLRPLKRALDMCSRKAYLVLSPVQGAQL
jgi:hypothetical protein